MTETEQKAAFAAFSLEYPDESPLSWAIRIFPAEKDRGLACQAAYNWPEDAEVVAEIIRLKNTGSASQKGLPGKDDLVRLLWSLAQNEKVSPKDRKDTIRVIAEVQGHIVKANEDEAPKRMPSKPVYKIVRE